MDCVAATSICVTAALVGAMPADAAVASPARTRMPSCRARPDDGSGTMGRGKRLCAPRSVGLYEWQVRWVEQIVKPTEDKAPP